MTLNLDFLLFQERRKNSVPNNIGCDSNGEHETTHGEGDGIESDEGEEGGEESEGGGEEPGSWRELKLQQAHPHGSEEEESLELYLDLCEAFYLSHALGQSFSFPDQR